MTTMTWARKHSKLGLIILSYLAFIALGMPDGLLGVAWPSIRFSFSIPLDAIGMLLMAGMAGYMTSSFLSGTVVTRLGVGRVLAASCAMTCIALVGYTLVPQWWMMVLLGMVGGLGAGAIDAGLNTYVAAHFGERLMQWLHASWGIGITLGPIIMTFGLASLGSWHVGYRLVGGFQLVLAACFLLTLSMWNQEQRAAGGEGSRRLTDYKTSIRETLRQPQVWLSISLFIMYVGGETALGTWTYTLLTESRGIDPTAAGFWAGSYWATFTVGRVVAGLFARRAGASLLVVGGLTGALLGSLLLAWNPSAAVNLLAVALIGFSIAPIFPALMSGTSRRVGAHFAANTIGMQMAATGLGAAAVPALIGVFARQLSLEIIPLCLLVVYAGLFALYLLSVRSEKRS